MKQIVFKHYGWIAILMMIVGIGAAATIRPERFLGLSITWVGGVFSFVFFVQRQALEEMRLFKDLFTEFNRRYDTLNESLNRIVSKDQDSRLEPCEIDVLNDYFNLCAEEYLFFQRKLIYPEVWRAWQRGMTHFYENRRIGEYWREELESGSYYGMDLGVLKKA